jgi:histidine kinase 2/3/4 (cytokinin receptor)
MRLLLPLALFAKSLRTTGTAGYLASPSRMLREHWRWVIPAAWALMSYLIVDYTSSHAVEKRRESLASMCDERARMLQYQVSVSMNSLQALAILVSTFHHSKNPSSAIDQVHLLCYQIKGSFLLSSRRGESHLI